MTEPDIAAVVMAGGLGTRMRSAVPKHLHPLLGRRMVDWVVVAARELGAEPVVVASPDTRDAFEGVRVAVQPVPLGTGDAVRCARAELEGAAADVLVLSGDTPLLTAELLAELIATHRREGAAATVLTFEPADPRSYGRVLRDGSGHVDAIVEAADADEGQLAVRECNSSIYVFRSELLWPALDRLQPHNAQGELYLTDAVRFL
ncbi:MAG TPA: NTP transferase domain-containing protein, partial [Gaiellaceae bacterium]